MDYLGRKYKLKKSENFDEFMKYLGVGLVKRTTASATTPVVILEKAVDEADCYVFTTTTMIKTIVLSFKLDEEFDEERADGVMVKSTISLNGNVMTHVQKADDGKTTTIVREFGAQTLRTVCTVEGWDKKCERIYEIID